MMESLPLEITETILSYLPLNDIANVFQAIKDDKRFKNVRKLIEQKTYSIQIYNHSNYNVEVQRESWYKLSEALNILENLHQFDIQFYISAYDHVSYAKLIEKYHYKFNSVQFICDEWSSFRELVIPNDFISSKTTEISINCVLQKSNLDKILNQFPNLCKLSITCCELEIELPEFTNLKSVFIEGWGTEISNLPSSIESLSLVHCTVDTSCSPLKKLTQLVVKEVSNAEFVIDLIIASKSSLQKLTWIQENEFVFPEELLHQLQQFPHLKELNFNNVNLDSLFPLNLSTIQVRSCTDWNIHMPFLSQLSLTCFDSSNSTDYFFGYPSLMKLSIHEITLNSENCILNFPNQITHLELKSWKFDNEIEVFPSKNLQLPEKLQYLTICRAKLDQIPQLNKHIQTLNLPNNLISEIDNFLNLQQLTELDLRSNKLTNVCIKAPNLKILTLADNPISNLLVNSNLTKLTLDSSHLSLIENASFSTTLSHSPSNSHSLGGNDVKTLESSESTADSITIPSGIQSLELKKLSAYDINFYDNSTLKDLVMEVSDCTKCVRFPDSLKTLILYLFKKIDILNFNIPKGIEELSISNESHSSEDQEHDLVLPSGISPNIFFRDFANLARLKLKGINLPLTARLPLELPSSLKTLELSAGISDEIHLQFPPGESELLELVLLQYTSDEEPSKYTFESIGQGINGCIHSNLEYIISNTPPFLPQYPQISADIAEKYEIPLEEFEEFEIRLSRDEISLIYKQTGCPPNLILIEIEDEYCLREPLVNPRFEP